MEDIDKGNNIHDYHTNRQTNYYLFRILFHLIKSEKKNRIDETESEEKPKRNYICSKCTFQAVIK